MLKVKTESVQSKIARINDELISMWLKGDTDGVCAVLLNFAKEDEIHIEAVERVVIALCNARNPQFVYLPRLYTAILTSIQKPENKGSITFLQPKQGCFDKIEKIDYVESIPKQIKFYISKLCKGCSKNVKSTVYKNCLLSIILGKPEFVFKCENFNFVVELCRYILYNIYEELDKELSPA